MTIEEIKTVCFVGAGTMGCFNSLVAALAGYDAVVWDASTDALQQAPQRLREMGDYFVILGHSTPAQIDEALSRLRFINDPQEAAAHADLLSESVFEQLELKRQVHQQFERLCPPHTIMTTNTSMLLVSGIESAVKRGERFAALHAHLFSELFDIVGGPRTAPATIDTLVRYVRSLGGIPIVLRRERPGYLYNALLGALLYRAMLLVIDGQAGLQDVDRAWMQGFNAEAGPFGMMDAVGLNIIFDSAAENASDPVKAEASRKIVRFVQPFMERGELGVKAGKGFYTYPDPAFARQDFMAGGGPLDHLIDILFLTITANALLPVIDGDASHQDVDRAWMAALHMELGPFGMIDRKGIDAFLYLLENRGQGALFVPEEMQKIQSFLRPYFVQGDLGVKTGRGFYTYPDPAFAQPGFLAGH